MGRGVAGKPKAGSIRRSRHSVQVRTIVIAIGLEIPDARRDDMTWKIREEDNVVVGKTVRCHDHVKIRARDSQDFTSGTIKVSRDGILLVALIFLR